jgi:arylsulfatase A-like enzyme
MTIDVLPTVAKLINASLPKHPIDGRDIWPLMANETNAGSPHEAYYLYWGNELQAVRSGPWKLHFTHAYRSLNGTPGGKAGVPAKYESLTIEQSLFNLEDDPKEMQNVADYHPEVVKQLMTLADQARSELGDGKQRGSGVRNAGGVDKEK